MTLIGRACANNTLYPHGTLDRLALFAEWTGTTPPETILEDQGDGWTFSTKFLRYAETTGLSLDWVWLGDEKSLVMQAHAVATGCTQ